MTFRAWSSADLASMQPPVLMPPPMTVTALSPPQVTATVSGSAQDL